MRATTRIAAVLASLVALPALAVAATIGGNYYAPQYDYREFFAATDGKNFPVILAGDAFPEWIRRRGARSLAGDAAREAEAGAHLHLRPADPAGQPGLPAGAGVRSRQQPERRPRVRRPAAPLQARHARPLLRLRDLLPQRAGPVVYTTAWTQASGPADPRIEQLFRELFMVVFNDQQQRFAELNPMLIP